MNEWMNEWMDEWTNEWLVFRLADWLMNTISDTIPLKIIITAVSHSIMNHTHGMNNLLFDFRCTHNIKRRNKVIWDSNQSILGPAAKPIHSTAADQAREFERSITELFSNLENNVTDYTRVENGMGKYKEKRDGKHSETRRGRKKKGEEDGILQKLILWLFTVWK